MRVIYPDRLLPPRRLVRCSDMSELNRKCVTQTKNDVIDPDGRQFLGYVLLENQC